MRLAIHQPEFMPWAGYFNKMVQSDLFIILDHVQFKKRYFENRNRIVSPRGKVSYLTVPVKTKGKYTQSICNVEIDNTQSWKNLMLERIRHSYSKATFFEKYYDDIKSLLNTKQYNNLLALNMDIINLLREYLGIHTPMLYSTSMNVGSFKASDLILQTCLMNRADTYLCGISGRDYIKLEDFEKNNIQIESLDYQPASYKQLCSSFVPYMSTLDILFNHGERSRDIVTNIYASQCSS